MRAVLALCLVALVGAQVASAGLIYQQTYSTDYINNPQNFFCNGTAQPIFKNYTGGECNNGANNATSFAYYCADNGANVIAISYSSGNCPAANVTGMSKTPTTCGAGLTYAKWVCSGTDALPNSWTFPPSGWSTSSTQYNNTNDGTVNGESKAACGNVNRPVTVQSAGNPICVNSQGTANQNPRRSTRAYHDSWQAQFSDYDCKDANLYSVTQGFTTGCNNGITQNGISGGPDVPSVPINYATNNIKASRTQYSKSGSNYCGTKMATTYFASSCFDSQKVVCENGTNYYEYNYGANADGACSGGQVNGYPKWKNTSSNFCEQIGASDYGYQYSCSGDSPNGPNAASTASFSVVALAIAAIVALLSQ